VTTWTVPAIITRVVDGDTLDAELDLGWHIAYHAKIRLAGVNCPEMSTPEGPVARAFTVNALNQLMPLGDDGPLAAHVTVVSHSLDKYGRVLATVLLGPNDSLNARLLDAGQAVVMK
jgi:endonuclease YncB( thermonuclease family)